MWTTWEVEDACVLELDEAVTPPGLALELLVVSGWAIWRLEDGRVLRVARAGLA